MADDVSPVKYINDILALCDENSTYRQNCGNYKVSVHITLKSDVSDNLYKDAISLQYPTDVIEIQLIDDLYSIGLYGYVDLVNSGSVYDILLNKSNLFYLIINITEYNVDDTPLVKYEPYIFDISDIITMTQSDGSEILRINVVDMITSIFEQHNFASVIQYDSRIVSSSNYKEFMGYIFTYAKDHIATNFNNLYHLKKELLFGQDFKFLDQKLSGYDDGIDLNILIKDGTIGKIKRDSTIKQALDVIFQDCCTSLKTPERFKNEYQTIGDVLIPFFFKEEYPDPSFLYTSLNPTHAKLTIDNPIYNQVYGGEAPMLLYRHMSMRDIYLPFLIAFGSEKVSGVFEDINPQKGRDDVTALNGRYLGMIYDMKYNRGGTHSLYKLWKNVIFLACAKNAAGGDCVLIYFSWFYDFFNSVFLNESIQNGVSKKKQSNVVPAFHAMMAAQGVKHRDAKIDVEQVGYSSKIDEHNSFIYPSTTEDTLNECMRVMGKNLASFILANDSYEFTIGGSIRRRPNEIIRFGFDPISGDGSSQPKRIGTDINLSNYTYMYVSKVIHKFVGNEYRNTIQAYKFVDVFDFDD